MIRKFFFFRLVEVLLECLFRRFFFVRYERKFICVVFVWGSVFLFLGIFFGLLIYLVFFLGLFVRELAGFDCLSFGSFCMERVFWVVE